MRTKDLLLTLGLGLLIACGKADENQSPTTNTQAVAQACSGSVTFYKNSSITGLNASGVIEYNITDNMGWNINTNLPAGTKLFWGGTDPDGATVSVETGIAPSSYYAGGQIDSKALKGTYTRYIFGMINGVPTQNCTQVYRITIK